MSRYVAFYIVTLPLLKEYNAAQQGDKAAKAKYGSAYSNAYNEVKAEVEKLTGHLPMGERPLLMADELLEPQIMLINIKPRAHALLQNLKAIGRYSIHAVSV